LFGCGHEHMAAPIWTLVAIVGALALLILLVLI
jgi:hypothetical protein